MPSSWKSSSTKDTGPSDDRGFEFSRISRASRIIRKTTTGKVENTYLRECMAEFLGTFVLVLFGDGVVAQVVLGNGDGGSYLSINLCWGLGVVFGIHAAGGVSGAHLNPAVTTTLAVFRRIPFRKVPGYVCSQVLGAFAAGLVVLVVYLPLFDKVDPASDSTMGVFSTYPYAGVPNWNCFLNEVVGTALLLALLFALGDECNKPANPFSFPGAVGLLVAGIGMSFGLESGYAINPARDFGPRLASAVRFGSKVFTLHDNYFWIPMVAPVVGGLLGASLYELFIGIHHKPASYSSSQANTTEESWADQQEEQDTRNLEENRTVDLDTLAARKADLPDVFKMLDDMVVDDWQPCRV